MAESNFKTADEIASAPLRHPNGNDALIAAALVKRNPSGASSPNDAERVAARFHEVYELLAPDHGYSTREASAVPWKDVPEPNRSLMIHVAAFLLREGAIQVGPGLPESWPK